MKRKALLGLAIVVALYVAYTVGWNVASDTKAPVTSAVKAVKPPTVSELLKLVNAERAKVGVAPLEIDERLNWSAQQKVDDEVKYNYFGHESPKSPNSNGDSRQWLLASGIKCANTGENLVWNVDSKTHVEFDNTSKGTVKAWIASKSHYKAMVDPKYTHTGFGINGTQVAQHFCQK